MKFVPKTPINNILSSVQIMAWCRPGDKPLSEPMVVSLPTHICVTPPQWFNTRSSNLVPHTLVFRSHNLQSLLDLFCLYLFSHSYLANHLITRPMLLILVIIHTSPNVVYKICEHQILNSRIVSADDTLPIYTQYICATTHIKIQALEYALASQADCSELLLTLWARVSHICISEMNHHYLRKWLVTCWVNYHFDYKEHINSILFENLTI